MSVNMKKVSRYGEALGELIGELARIPADQSFYFATAIDWDKLRTGSTDLSPSLSVTEVEGLPVELGIQATLVRGFVATGRAFAYLEVRRTPSTVRRLLEGAAGAAE